MLRDVFCIIIISSALAFIQPRSTDVQLSWHPDPGDEATSMGFQNKETHYNNSSGQANYAAYPGQMNQFGTYHAPLRLVNMNSPGKNTSNPYFSQSVNNPYATWQITH